MFGFASCHLNQRRTKSLPVIQDRRICRHGIHLLCSIFFCFLTWTSSEKLFDRLTGISKHMKSTRSKLCSKIEKWSWLNHFLNSPINKILLTFIWNMVGQCIRTSSSIIWKNHSYLFGGFNCLFIKHENAERERGACKIVML